jgi:hypothetical protein
MRRIILLSLNGAAAQPSDAELAAASDPGAVVDPADLNFAWAGSGDRKLLPSRIYDDGQSTYLAWPAGTPVPAILVKDKQGTEGPVNYAVRGDVIVIDLVPKQIVLRSGRDAATIANNGPPRAPAALARLLRTVIEGGYVFDELMNTVRVCSLGQITSALFDVGGQYRRSM